MKLPAALQARWDAMSPREQPLVLAALVLVGVAALWWLGLAPALASLRAAQRQQPQLDAQWQQMQRLQVQAKTLQAQPRLAGDEARRLLDVAVKSLGAAAQLAVAGERVTLTLKSVPADVLAPWLTQVRLNARLVPSEAHLTRSPTGHWDGTLVFSLAAR